MPDSDRIRWNSVYERAWAAEQLGEPGLASHEDTALLLSGDYTASDILTARRMRGATVRIICMREYDDAPQS
jgi:hypothetical protein